LSIDLVSADCFFVARNAAKSEDIAAYFADLAAQYQAKGFKQLVIFLDRNPTHKHKMQHMFAERTTHLDIQTRFHLMAAYSPKLNLVEYVIHLIRQKVLHHADCKTSLAAFESSIKELCDTHQLFSKEQIVNTLVHIESLILKSITQSPERE
jgi:predicted XRE-type DNA-binding protein